MANIYFDTTMTVSELVVITGCLETWSSTTANPATMTLTGAFSVNRLNVGEVGALYMTPSADVSCAVYDTANGILQLAGETQFVGSSTAIISIDNENASSAVYWASLQVSGRSDLWTYVKMYHLQDLFWGATATCALSYCELWFDPTTHDVQMQGDLDLEHTKICAYNGEAWAWLLSGTLSVGPGCNFCALEWRLLSTNYDFAFSSNPTDFDQVFNAPIRVVHDGILGATKARTQYMGSRPRIFNIAGTFPADDNDNAIGRLITMYEDTDETFEFYWPKGYCSKVVIIDFRAPEKATDCNERPYTLQLMEVY